MHSPDTVEVQQFRELIARIERTQQELVDLYSEFVGIMAIWDGKNDPHDHRLRIDPATCTVYWDGRSCRLGNNLRFRLLARLARRPGYLVTYHQLRQDVWGGELRSRDSVRSVVRHLKNDLSNAGMQDLARCISGQSQRYVLDMEMLAEGKPQMPQR